MSATSSFGRSPSSSGGLLLALVAALLVSIASPVPGSAQNVQERDGWVSGDLLVGDWVRVESNNPRNNGMRIRVVADAEGVRAILTAMPPTASRAFRVGQLIWTDFDGSGTLSVRGSDGGYYSSSFTISGGAETVRDFASRLEIDIDHNGRGNDQTWERAGASIDGDWVLVDSSDPELSTDFRGLQVRVEGDRATVSYVTAVASSRYRTGEEFWQGIDGEPPENEYDNGSGILEYRESETRSWRGDPFELTGNGLLFVGTGDEYQVWARPEEAEERMAAAERGEPLMELPIEPADDPDAAGGDLERSGEERTVDVPDELPPPPPEPEEEAACLATSLRHDGTGVRWGLSMTTPNRNDPQAVGIGVRRFMPSQLSRWQMSTDVDRLLLPGFGGGFSFVWQPQTSAGGAFEEHRDLTAAQYDQREQAARSAGLRAIDFEAYETSSGMRYAGVWAQNAESLSWRVDYDQTSQQFGAAFPTLRNDGFRLVDIEAYETPNGIRYAGIWYRSCDNANWREWRGMDRTSYQARVDSLTALGFRVIDFESYGTSDGQRYAAIWERTTPGRSWAVRTDRTIKWFLNYHRQYVDEGLRLIDFESYDTPDGLRYAGVWGENDARYDFPLRAVLDDSIRAYRSRHAIPGISVVVIQDGDTIYRRGFGWADSAASKRAHSGTIYATASVAKVFGGTLAALLEERQEIDLRDTTANIVDYLGSAHTHTVEQLLSKTGCIRHYGGRDPHQRSDNGQSVWSRYYRWREVAIDSIQSPLLPNCTPGQNYSYSTHGYTFVGGALEEATGKDIVELVRDELTRPFGLSNLDRLGSFPVSGSSGRVDYYDLAQGYDFVGGANVWREVDYDETNWKVLGGGLQIDAMDLARFGWLTLNGDIVSATTRDDRLWDPVTDNVTAQHDTTGLAWVVEGRNPTRVDPATGAMIQRRVAEHGGSWLGARSILRIYRDDGLVIAILTNQRTSPIVNRHPIGFMRPSNGDLATAIAAVVFANPPPP